MKANNGLSDIWVTVVVENRSVRVDGMGLPYPIATIRFHGSVTRPKEFDVGANCTFSSAHYIHIDLHIDGNHARATQEKEGKGGSTDSGASHRTDDGIYLNQALGGVAGQIDS